MGTFTVVCELQELTGNRPPAQIADVMVDTGSEYTWLPEELLQEAGVTATKKDIAFVMANGTTITRDIGYAYLRSGSSKPSMKSYSRGRTIYACSVPAPWRDLPRG